MSIDIQILFRSGRISSVYIVSKWVVGHSFSKLVNFMIERVYDWKGVRLEECKIGRV